MIVRSILCALALAGGLLAAANVTGKWTANVPGRDGQTREVTYNLKADGNTLTGTMPGRGGQEIQITDGKIDGDTITFKTKMEFNGNTMIMNYTGKVEGDTIKFTSKREGGEQPPREFTAKRAQ
jgi:hypothetical protein